MKNNKDVAERAAARMCHGDVDPWRKKCESYGFLLAKSMIMMDAEILRERMKPENIKANIGQDAWDYANDRVIGTGKGWNHNLITQQMQAPGQEGTAEFPSRIDDSLARATIPQRDNSFEQAEEAVQEASLTEGNVANYNDYNADREVLSKEYALSKDLLDRAAASINSEYLKKLVDNKDANHEDLTAAHVFKALVSHLNEEEIGSHETWEDIIQDFNDEYVEKVQKASIKIEEGKYNKDVVSNLKEEFKDRSNDEDELLHNIKEYL